MKLLTLVGIFSVGLALAEVPTDESLRCSISYMVTKGAGAEQIEPENHCAIVPIQLREVRDHAGSPAVKMRSARVSLRNTEMNAVATIGFGRATLIVRDSEGAYVNVTTTETALGTLPLDGLRLQVNTKVRFQNRAIRSAFFTCYTGKPGTAFLPPCR